MDKKLSSDLVASLKQAGQIARGERRPSRVHRVSRSRVKAIRRSDPLHLWSKSGLEYARVRDFLELSTDDLAKVGGVSPQSVRFDARIPPDLRDGLEQIANICTLVAEHFDADSERTALWFRMPNSMLGDVSPRDMIRLGRYKRLLKFVAEARSANGRGERRGRA